MMALLRRLLLHAMIVIIVLVLGFATGMLVGWVWPELHLRLGGGTAAVAPVSVLRSS